MSGMNLQKTSWSINHSRNALVYLLWLSRLLLLLLLLVWVTDIDTVEAKWITVVLLLLLLLRRLGDSIDEELVLIVLILLIDVVEFKDVDLLGDE